MGSFFAQFCALCKKNGIILWRHRWINLLRCLLLPLAYAAFFSQAQNYFESHANLGEGNLRDLRPINHNLAGYKLLWSPPSSAADNDTVSTFIDQLMASALQGVTGNVQKIDNSSAINDMCPTNFNLRSSCYGAVVFESVDPANLFLNYTIKGDLGLNRVDVYNPANDDSQSRILPLQWAIERSFINLTTGNLPDQPLVWEFTNESAKSRSETNRMAYLRGIRQIIVLAHFLVFLGIIYQLPGSISGERAAGLTAHLDAMGCGRVARMISWHLSVSSIHFLSWIGVAIIFKIFIFLKTNTGLLIALYLLTGFNLASWAELAAVPFGSTPTFAAIAASFAAIVFAVLGLVAPSGYAIQVVLGLFFPPMSYIFLVKNLTAFEVVQLAPNTLEISPKGDAPLLAIIIVQIVGIFVFPGLAMWMESIAYGVKPPGYVSWFRRSNKYATRAPLDPAIAVELDHLRKTFSTKTLGIFGRGKPFVAIEDLSLSIPRGGIFCLLGRNGAAKSTALEAIACLSPISDGDIRYAEDLHVGFASQKDVLWGELTCRQHIDLWRAIKMSTMHRQEETNEQLLTRCDLGAKVSCLSKNLSGGQRRKLQLACALAGGSSLLLLDEITSGLDPLSRRAIWRVIACNRGSATIIMSTHFLDEADYLGDQVAILEAPGKLLALDSPVALKQSRGKGFTLTFDPRTSNDMVILSNIQRQYPFLSVRESRGKFYLSTGSCDPARMKPIVDALQASVTDNDKSTPRYQVSSGSLEEVFLDLNGGDTGRNGVSLDDLSPPSTAFGSATPERDGSIVASTVIASSQSITFESSQSTKVGTGTPASIDLGMLKADALYGSGLSLTPGHKRSTVLNVASDAWTIMRKRLIILRRSWLLSIVGIATVTCAICIPLVFLSPDSQTCDLAYDRKVVTVSTYPQSYYLFSYRPMLFAPRDIGQTYAQFLGNTVQLVKDNQTFLEDVAANASTMPLGGVVVPTDAEPGRPVFAFEGTSQVNKGIPVLNTLSNTLLNILRPPVSDVTATNAFRINVNFQYFPTPSFVDIAQAIKWIAFFGLGISIWPAFAAIYPTTERMTKVRANQYSNGASPMSLWLGHILFELPAILVVSVVIVTVLFTKSSQFAAPGDLFACLVLYGVSSTLYAYIFALFLDSALASWALVAGSNVILFLLYLASYLLISTYSLSSNASSYMTICHFTIGVISPVPNMVRAILVSVNLFGLLCDGLGHHSPNPYSDIKQFGGPVLYMVLQILFAFGVLVWVDSGLPFPRLRKRHFAILNDKDEHDPSEQELVVSGLKKKYRGTSTPAVDGVSFGVSAGETFALIGPNGAGKSTALACIRGLERPSGGDVHVLGHSIIRERNQARSHLGVCPQYNPIDTHLTVRQHLWLYGRLKGVPKVPLDEDIRKLLHHAGLGPKADVLATSLSGGNQRKLCLAMALIGDRSVVLIDEFSSGVDPFSKREAWAALSSLTRDRAVVLTTHSMEEVDALASRVGIIAGRMLVNGTRASLKSEFASYEVHIASRHVERLVSILRQHGFTRARASSDTSTRVSVPGVSEGQLSRLLGALAVAQAALGTVGMTLHEASTETAFLEIVRAHNVAEEQGRNPTSAG